MAVGRCDRRDRRPPHLCRCTHGSPPAGDCGHMMHTGQEAETTVQSLMGREVVLMLQPLSRRVQAVLSLSGYSSGEQGQGCLFGGRREEAISSRHLWGTL